MDVGQWLHISFGPRCSAGYADMMESDFVSPEDTAGQRTNQQQQHEGTDIYSQMFPLHRRISSRNAPPIRHFAETCQRTTGRAFGRALCWSPCLTRNKQMGRSSCEFNTAVAGRSVKFKRSEQRSGVWFCGERCSDTYISLSTVI